MPDSSRAAHGNPNVLENLTNITDGRVLLITILASPVRARSEESLSHLVAHHGTERMGGGQWGIREGSDERSAMQRGCGATEKERLNPSHRAPGPSVSMAFACQRTPRKLVSVCRQPPRCPSRPVSRGEFAVVPYRSL